MLKFVAIVVMFDIRVSLCNFVSRCIYVWASGNGNGKSDTCNYDGYANSRYTVTFGAVQANGQVPGYSEVILRI